MSEDETLDLEWLAPWLESAQLSHHLEEAKAWCDSMGAGFRREVQQLWEEFADELQLTASERVRLAKVCTEANTSVDEKTSSNVCAAKVPHSFCSSQGFQYTVSGSKPLGQGAFGTVCCCTRGEEQLAVKIIRLEALEPSSSDPFLDIQKCEAQRLLETLNREVTILLSLRHPHIVQLHDYVDTVPGWYFIVMEFVAGGDLFEYITKRGRMVEAEARYVFVQLIDGLQYVHSKHIIHRDLKPSNILVDSTTSRPGLPKVKIADFGHAKQIADGYTRAETLGGTAQYWAPEVSKYNASRPPSYDYNADLWSLGVVLYCMLAGKLPFKTTEDALEAQFSYRGNYAVDELLHGLICVNAKKRTALADCLKSPWVAHGVLGSMPSGGASLHAEQEAQQPRIVMRLPRAPRDVSVFQKDLRAFARKYRVSAALRVLEVVVSFGPQMQQTAMEEAQAELMQLVALYLPELNSQPDVEHRNFRPIDAETISARDDERVSLEAIYNEAFKVVGVAEWFVKLHEGVALRVFLPQGYPLTEPPNPLIECTRKFPPVGLAEELLAQWSPGTSCVYAMVEVLRSALEALENIPENEECPIKPVVSDASMSQTPSQKSISVQKTSENWRAFGGEHAGPDCCVEIIHSDCIEINESKFQAHLAKVCSMEEVNWVHRRLLEDKVAEATHNIVAYRFLDGDGQFICDFDDDLEMGAGSQLMQFLEEHCVQQVFLMVTRWHNGVYVGPVRFKNILSVAQAVLKHNGRKLLASTQTQ